MLAGRKLYLAAIALALLGLASLALVNAQTGTVTITVLGKVVASEVDSESSITVDPANSPVMRFGNIIGWNEIAASDDMTINLTGTNVNFTVYATYDIVLPKSYPSGLATPLLGCNATVATTSNPLTLGSIAAFPLDNTSVTLDPNNDLLLNIAANLNVKQVSTVDLPEGFLNDVYGKTLNETEWYDYVYYKEVELPSLAVLYDPTTGKRYVQNSVSLCLLLVDPDSSLAGNSAFSGDEMVIVNTDCKFDKDDSNATTTTTFRGDLVSTADYAFVVGYNANIGDTAERYYNYSQLDFTLLNITASFSGSTLTSRLYFKLYKSSADTQSIELKFTPVHPVSYDLLGAIYGKNNKPYLHIWPMILVPVGAPAATYKATVYVYIEQT